MNDDRPVSASSRMRVALSDENVWLFIGVFAVSLGLMMFAFSEAGRSAAAGEVFHSWRVLVLAVGWMPALAAVVWAAWCPARALAVLLFLSAASSDWFELAVAGRTGFSKVFYYDVILGVALLGAALRIAAEWRDQRWPRTRISLPLLVYCAAGLLFLYRGWGTAEKVNDALGDFRRVFFYPLVFFLALWETRRNPRAAAWMGGAFVCGALTQVVSGYLSVFMGRFRQLFFADVFHILSHYSTTMLSIVFYLGLAALLVRRRRRGVYWSLAAAGSVVLLIVIANFRAAWIGLVAGTAVCLARSPVGLAQLRRFFLPVLSGLVLIAVVFLALGKVELAPGATLKGEVLEKLNRLRNFQSDPNVQWRFASYRAAMKGWREHPVLGAGLGNQTTFYAPGAFGGQYLAFGHRVHNSYLWFLYATGSAGFALFLWVQVTLFLCLWRGARAAQEEMTKVWVLAFLGFYAHFLAVTAFHHLFESSVPSLTLYALAGLTLGVLAEDRAASTVAAEWER